MTRSRHALVGLAAFAVALALPAVAAAQASTFIIPFNRTGVPGTECVQVIDPITGLPEVDATGTPVVACHPVGAFVDPCTSENVDVIGSTTLSIFTNVTGSNQLKVSIGAVTKGSGTGQVSLTPYGFAENQQFNTQFTLNGLPTSITESEFSDKLFLKGAKSIDNWTIKATFKIQINGNGVVTSTIASFTGDVCKG